MALFRYPASGWGFAYLAGALVWFGGAEALRAATGLGSVVHLVAGFGFAGISLTVALYAALRLRPQAGVDAWYRSLFDRYPDGLVAIDRDGRLTEVNGAAASLTGYRPNELTGRHLSDLLPAEALGDGSSALATVLNNERVSFESPLLRKDGGRSHVRFTVVPITDGSRTIGAYGIIKDLSEWEDAARRLESSEQRYRSLLTHSPNAVYVLDLDGRFSEANDAAMVMTGYDRKDLIGHAFEPLIAPDDLDHVREQFRKVVSGHSVQFQTWLIRGDGSRRRLEVSGGPMMVEGEIVGAAAVATDVTERLQAEEELRITANALDNMVEGALITDTDWRIISVNRAFTQITGYQPEEVRGKTPPQIGSGLHNPSDYVSVQGELESRGYWQGEFWHRRKGGDTFPMLMTWSAVRDDQGVITHYVAVFNDISENKDYEARLEFLSYWDPLTGLANRALFQEQAQEALAWARRRETPMGVLLVDLDQFKHVNESLGHEAGDDLLREVGARLRGQLRETDTVARLGGDEFAVVLGELADLQDAAVVARKLLDTLADPVSREGAGRELFTSASIGIGCFPQDGEDVETLLRNAEAAMYQAKSEGRNAYRFFSPELNARAVATLAMANDLRLALEHGDFELYFQPLVSLEDGRILGTEALLRWQHADRGWVSPGEFIPVAESTGMIGRLGAWVLETACRQARSWLDAGYSEFRMAVNLSPRQFRDRQLGEQIRRILEDTGLPPEALVLEITESTVMEDASRAREILDALHRLGVTVALDDFGTGYSSLAYLRDFRFDELKIDRGFVAGIPGEADQVAITETIIAMADSLGIRAIAEGVETADQAAFLRERGCLAAQGFRFARAMPPDKVERLLQRPYPFRAAQTG